MPPGARRRHGEDLVSAVAAANRRSLLRAIGLQVLPRDDPSVLGHLFLEELRGLPFVEAGGSSLGDAYQRLRQIRLLEELPDLVGLAVLRELFRGRGELRKALPVGGERRGEAIRHRETFAREANRRLEKLLPRKASLLLPGQVKPGYRPGNSDREMRLVVLLIAVLALFVEPHLGVRLRGRHLPEIVRGGLARSRPENQKSSAPDIPRGGMRYRESERSRDRGVDGVSARLHHVDSDAGSDVALRNHHAVLPPRRLVRGESGCGGENEDDRGGNPAKTTQSHGVDCTSLGRGGSTRPCRETELDGDHDLSPVEDQHREPPEEHGRERERERASERPRPGGERALVEELI